MDKGFLKGLLVGFCLTFVMVSIFVFVISKGDSIRFFKPAEPTEAEVTAEKMQTLIDYINLYYDGEYDEGRLLDYACYGLVSGLGDKYSAYYTEDDYRSLAEKTEGKYVGIGAYVSYTQDGKYPMISAPMKGSPAEKYGLMVGDIIVEIDGVSTYEMELDAATAMVKGEEGSEVVLTIKREGEEEYLTITVVRQKVETITVEHEMLDENIGYIQVTSFDKKTSEQFDEAVNTLTDEGMEGLIIDIRDNPGGLLYSSTSMLDRILPKGKLLVYTMDKNDRRDEIVSENEDTVDVPIVIIMNENSASSSEVFAGCLKDYDAATIVGETSFGKGIVQTVYNFMDGSRIKLTTASYYSPDGHNIHGTGIKPDVEVIDDESTEVDEQLEAAINVLIK